MFDDCFGPSGHFFFSVHDIFIFPAHHQTPPSCLHRVRKATLTLQRKSHRRLFEGSSLERSGWVWSWYSLLFPDEFHIGSISGPCFKCSDFAQAFFTNCLGHVRSMRWQNECNMLTLSSWLVVWFRVHPCAYDPYASSSFQVLPPSSNSVASTGVAVIKSSENFAFFQGPSTVQIHLRPPQWVFWVAVSDGPSLPGIDSAI